MKINVVNENRLLSLISNFFKKQESVLVEIAQNAVRSGTTKLDITLEKGWALCLRKK